MGNYELLLRALPFIREHVCSMVECASQLHIVRAGDLELIQPLPDSIPAEDLPEIEEALALIRDIEAVTGRRFAGPEWFDLMVSHGAGGQPLKGGA